MLIKQSRNHLACIHISFGKRFYNYSKIYKTNMIISRFEIAYREAKCFYLCILLFILRDFANINSILTLSQFK